MPTIDRYSFSQKDRENKLKETEEKKQKLQQEQVYLQEDRKFRLEQQKEAEKEKERLRERQEYLNSDAYLKSRGICRCGDHYNFSIDCPDQWLMSVIN